MESCSRKTLLHGILLQSQCHRQRQGHSSSRIHPRLSEGPDNPNPSGCFPEFQRYVPSTVTPLSRAAPPAQLPRLGIIPISFVPPGQRIPSSPSLFLEADPWEEGHGRNQECLTRPVLTLGAAEQTPSVGKPNKHRSKVAVISLKSKDNYPSPKLPHPEAPAPARHWN